MPYITLGPRKVIASADLTGLNPGNLTCAFPASFLNVNEPYFEMYHIIVNSVPAGASATIYLNSQQWGFTYPVSGSEWDPTQPMLLRPGDEVDFCWSAASSVTPAPVVTIWLRFDPATKVLYAGGPTGA